MTARPSCDHPHRARRRKRVGLFTLVIAATAAIIVVLTIVSQNQQSTLVKKWKRRALPSGKRNLIFMVSDGMGPASVSMARTFSQWQGGHSRTLILDQHLIGKSRTRSSNNPITDSAAGATAFSCGKKTYNGAIGVLPDQTPCGTVLEAAKAAGYMTGLVATTRITDATPAAFSAHTLSRSYEDLIAEQQIGEYPLGLQLDLLLGGGRCHFLPGSAPGSCRDDEKDIVRLAKSRGFSYIDSRRGFDSLKGGAAAKLPLLGLVAETDVPFEIDRRFQNNVYPSLEEMTRTSLRALSDATRDSDQGFFLMIEGSRIDHAGHANDPAAQVHEVLAYDRVFSIVLEFLENESTPTIVLSTSDHETGGLADTPSRWQPSVLGNATHSVEYLAEALRDYLAGPGKSAPKNSQRAFVRRELVEKGLGIPDSTDREINQVLDSSSPDDVLADLISRRAQVGWSTHGHTGKLANIISSINERRCWVWF